MKSRHQPRKPFNSNISKKNKAIEEVDAVVVEVSEEEVETEEEEVVSSSTSSTTATKDKKTTNNLIRDTITIINSLTNKMHTIINRLVVVTANKELVVMIKVIVIRMDINSEVVAAAEEVIVGMVAMAVRVAEVEVMVDTSIVVTVETIKLFINHDGPSIID